MYNALVKRKNVSGIFFQKRKYVNIIVFFEPGNRILILTSIWK